MDQLYSALSFDSTTHDHLLDRQYYSVNLLMAALKFYLERRNYRAYIFAFAISAPLYIYIYIYIYIFLSGLPFTDTVDS